MNFATIIGIIGGILVLSFAVQSSTQSTRIFLNLPGLAIVLGGITAATLISYSLRDMLRVLQGFGHAVKGNPTDLEGTAAEMERLAGVMLRQGQDQLEQEIADIDDPHLCEGLQMVVEHASPERIRKLMESRLDKLFQREMSRVEVFRTMGRLSPAFGIIGTLVGLIGMMQNMQVENISQIGVGMAVALTTTFYGVLLSSLVFHPVAVKLEKRLEQQVILINLIMEGTLLIQAKTPPVLVADQLQNYLPTKGWTAFLPSRPDEDSPDTEANALTPEWSQMQVDTSE